MGIVWGVERERGYGWGVESVDRMGVNSVDRMGCREREREGIWMGCRGWGVERKDMVEV